jgi:hypothetical protein
MLKKILIGVGLLVVAVVAYGVISFGPRNIIGMLRYDQREEGKLKVGDPAPDVALLALDGTTPVRLKDSVGGKPLILVFGSFT